MKIQDKVIEAIRNDSIVGRIRIHLEALANDYFATDPVGTADRFSALDQAQSLVLRRIIKSARRNPDPWAREVFAQMLVSDGSFADAVLACPTKTENGIGIPILSHISSEAIVAGIDEAIPVIVAIETDID